MLKHCACAVFSSAVEQCELFSAPIGATNLIFYIYHCILVYIYIYINICIYSHMYWVCIDVYIYVNICTFLCIIIDAQKYSHIIVSILVQTQVDVGWSSCRQVRAVAQAHMSLPLVVVGLDVETSDWSRACSFQAQDSHLRGARSRRSKSLCEGESQGDSQMELGMCQASVGGVCDKNHRIDLGCICQVGWAIFRCSSESYYVAEDPVSLIVLLPDGERVAEKANKYNGICDSDCAKGLDFEDAMQRLTKVLEETGAKIVCHNLAHEALVFCRELQKRDLSLPVIMNAIVEGECTNQMTKRCHGTLKKLSAAYEMIPGAPALRAHDAGQDAAMAGRLYLHYLKKNVNPSTESQSCGEEPGVKRPRCNS